MGTCGEKVVLSMFMGEYQHTIDEKSRITLPNKFRAELGEIFVATKGFDKCLYVWTSNDWRIFEEKLKNLPMSRADARAVMRHFFAGAAECEVDKNGRVLLPAVLRNYAGLEKEAVVIGVSNHIEIWSKDEWTKYLDRVSPTVDELAEQLADLGI